MSSSLSYPQAASAAGEADVILDRQIIRLKRRCMNSFGFEPAWNAYFDFYLSSKYVQQPLLQLEDVTFHLFLRKNLNDQDPAWQMPSMRQIKRRLGIGQDRIEAMIERLVTVHLLEKVSGEEQGEKGEHMPNTYLLSHPISRRLSAGCSRRQVYLPVMK
jgi:hypothetical protein